MALAPAAAATWAWADEISGADSGFNDIVLLTISGEGNDQVGEDAIEHDTTVKVRGECDRRIFQRLGLPVSCLFETCDDLTHVTKTDPSVYQWSQTRTFVD
jgi:hypothetical protein